MIYKILIVKNRIPEKLNFSKGLDWFSSHTPLQFEIEEMVTDFEVTTFDVSNATYHGVVCGDDILLKLRAVIPEGKYHCVVFVVGNEMNGIRVFGYAGGESLYYDTDILQLFKISDGGMVLNHELIHTFFNRLRRQQISVEDPMDSVVYNGKVQPYFNDKDPEANPGNRSIALERLQAHWNQLSIIPIKINMSTYKNFSAAEVAKWKLKPELFQILDDARSLSGTSFIITSGLRTPKENVSVGGKPDSAHLKALAADLLCTDNTKRTAMIRGILGCGRPVFLEIAKSHLHVDIDSSIHALGQTIISNDE